jgi:hypothetical protein
MVVVRFPKGVLGGRHLATVPQRVAGDRLPWGGAGQGEVPPRGLLFVGAISRARAIPGK